MQKTLTCILILFVCLSCTAQEKIRRGEIILKDGTKQTGYINYKNWNINPETIDFSATGQHPFKKLGIKDLMSFSISDGEIKELYKLYTVGIDTSGQDLNEMNRNRLPEIKYKAIFLQTIVEGNISLYLVKITETRNQFFIQNGSGIPTELLYKKYMVNDKLMENTSYKNDLFLALNKCSLITENELRAIGYTEKQLSELIIKFNKCTGGNEGPTSVKQDYKLPLGFSIYGGLNINDLTIKSAAGETGYNFTTHAGATFGAQMELMIGRTNKRYSAIISAGYKNYLFKAQGRESSVITYYDYIIREKLSYITTEAGIKRYFYLNNHVAIFSQLSYNNAFVVSSEGTKTETSAITGSVTLPYLAPARKHEQALQLIAGCSLNKLQAGLLYSRSNGFSPYSSTKTIINSLGFRLNYKLK